jgi:hypothetical protein
MPNVHLTASTPGIITREAIQLVERLHPAPDRRVWIALCLAAARRAKLPELEIEALRGLFALRAIDAEDAAKGS